MAAPVATKPKLDTHQDKQASRLINYASDEYMHPMIAFSDSVLILFCRIS
jgi:hypothetical protein